MTDYAKSDIPVEVPEEVLSSPALLFLYYRLEQILGIKTKTDGLIKLNEYMEKTCGNTFVENPASYEYLLSSREQIYNVSKFLTVNETYFFRESSQFNLLESLLPQLAELKRPIHICSAACSIGCEAYSIAILMEHHKKNGLDIDYTVDAFDVNSEAIETAKNARFTANTLRNDGSSWKFLLDFYTNAENEKQGEFTIDQNIRRKVRFYPHNLMRGLEKHYDIVFFRNALIYFTVKNRFSVINNMAKALNNGGYLFTGSSETSSVEHPLLADRFSSGVFYFQKIKNYNPLDNLFLFKNIKEAKWT
jgi:chemotaxis protein methyltransferase CheR